MDPIPQFKVLTDKLWWVRIKGWGYPITLWFLNVDSQQSYVDRMQQVIPSLDYEMGTYVNPNRSTESIHQNI